LVLIGQIISAVGLPGQKIKNGFGHHRIKGICSGTIPAVETSLLLKARKKPKPINSLDGMYWLKRLFEL
jgi:hypothetical protein